MSKIKSFSGLDQLYASIQQNTVKVDEAKKPAAILPTNTAMYLPESTQDIGADTKVELADKKKTGPHGADNFEPVKKPKKEGNAFAKAVIDAKKDGIQPGEKVKVPGSDKEVPLKEADEEKEEGDEAEETEHHDKKHHDKENGEDEKEEKVEENVETVAKSNKYKKHQFTMPKSKFDQLYEDAVNNVPFVSEEEDMTPVAPAADAGADAGAGDELNAPAEEATISHQEAVEALEKVLAFLRKDIAHDIETGTLGDEEGAMGGEDETPVMEEVEAEDLGHAGVGSGAKSEQLKDGHKLKTVGTGTVTQKGGAAHEQGAPGTVQDPTPKKAKDFDKGLQKPTGNNQTGNLKTGKDLFAN